MLLNDNNNLIKKVTFFYDSKNTNMAGPPSSQSELSYEHTYMNIRLPSCRDVQGFLNLYLMLMYDSLKDWCSSQYSKTLFLFVLGQILKIL